VRNREEIIEIIRGAGVVGAGGAGFPTHVKYIKPVEELVINGAECEPLLWKDKEILRLESRKLVSVISTMLEAGFYSSAVVAVKRKAKDAISSLEKAILDSGETRIRIHKLENFYPSGDEIVQIQEATGRTVPYGQLPSKVGVVVNNVETYVNIYNALSGVPNFSNMRIAVFSPTPGKLHKTESCCFCKSFDFLIFLINGPFVAFFLEHIDANSLAV
jgi:Na+-translocating ferredoxin:NAD+ oxidoreductase RnfC subunit